MHRKNGKYGVHEKRGGWELKTLLRPNTEEPRITRHRGRISHNGAQRDGVGQCVLENREGRGGSHRTKVHLHSLVWFLLSCDRHKAVHGTFFKERKRTASFAAMNQEVRNLNTTLKTYWQDPAYLLRFPKDQGPKL